jgi:hypothetical protein
VGSVRNNPMGPRPLGRRRVAAVVAVVLALAAATTFVVKTRSDLHSARSGLRRSEHNVSVLHTRENDAIAHRTAALTALDQARETLRSDTAARDAMRETDRAQYALLGRALQTLSQHKAELAKSATHAALLDTCLAGASQVLNEAAVGDVVHLASTLPPVQKVCSQAAQ